MTTFTKISDQETPVITIHPHHRLAYINPLIYGGFTEHMGRCIYGGIYDPGNPLSDDDGFRQDVLDALKELKVPVIRYPGGNFCATYHWLDGVGPREKRPKRPELAWLGTEPNTFGTDEFMKWCKKLGAEPYLCLNMGTGTLDEALAWLEYCNGTGDTYYANLRRENGHHEPYNVKYWALGNEVWGPWQVAQASSPQSYAQQAIQWAKALKLLCPTIVTILCGCDGVSNWDFEVLKAAVLPTNSPLSTTGTHLVDMHSIHMYTASKDHVMNAVAPLAAERAIETTAALISLARITNKVPPPPAHPDIKICFDEWNVWDPVRAEGSKGAEERYTLSDALAVGVWLNVFVRQAKHLGMANIAQSVNVISPLMTSKEGITRQTIWWPLWLFSKYMQGETVAAHVACTTYDGLTEPFWLEGDRDISWLDVSAAVDEDGCVNLVVVNVSEDRDFETRICGISPQNAHVFTISGKDVQVTNMDGKEQVSIMETSWNGKGKYNFQKHSLTLLRYVGGSKAS